MSYLEAEHHHSLAVHLKFAKVLICILYTTPHCFSISNLSTKTGPGSVSQHNVNSRNKSGAPEWLSR